MLGLNQDLLVILLIAGLIFGAKKLPEIGKGLGKGIKEFKSGISGQEEDETASKPKEIPEEPKNK
ncbi:MAG TPA: twin-arginine translocase TatA/TatE family subunit [Thermodesulfobacteriota bacterium]|nr:twin-arginine translocase TatA/TatE family subunit [Thermodesulfobacteriota bacterium]